MEKNVHLMFIKCLFSVYFTLLAQENKNLKRINCCKAEFLYRGL